MDFALLAVGAYLLGSVPAAYLAARLARGIDLRQYGTGSVGVGNLWEMTSKRVAIPAAVFDLGKGTAMVWAAQLLGLGITEQVTVGLATVIGHNWSVFLRFKGGRGILTTLGVVFILMPWGITVAFLAIALTLRLKTSPLPVLAGIAVLPLVSWGTGKPLPVTLGLLALLVIVVIGRLMAPRRAEGLIISRNRLLLNRLLFDRDIGDREEWLYQVPAEANLTEAERARLEKKKQKKGLF